ncbi:MAG: hypothetical protein KatS3mg110_2944 [Pirellulaceae bacterium]|nr:MAG: hypothetical protein KatS3mg110_2944 [Pirellulaceae bacterium]
MARRKSLPRDPAPAEIQYLCAQIRQGWSETTYRLRAGYADTYEEAQRSQCWLPPVIRLDELEWPEELERANR